jgi:hypothetical protein
LSHVELCFEPFGHGVHLVAQRSNVRFDVCNVRAQVRDVRLESKSRGSRRFQRGDSGRAISVSLVIEQDTSASAR